MRSWLTNQKRIGTDTASIEWQTASAGRRVINRLLEVLRVCRRSQEAAHYYEKLKSQSDQALAGKGLKRSDLPRAALEKLRDGE
jgi:hypothetical protein